MANWGREDCLISARSPQAKASSSGGGDRDLTGFSVSSAGDINGDGIDDLIVGTPDGNIGAYHAGQAYAIYGQAGTRGLLDLSTLSSSQGFIVHGRAVEANLGLSVSSAGDVNGDGIDDLILGDRNGWRSGNTPGDAYVVYGQAGTRGQLDLTTLSDSQGFSMRGGYQGGVSVSSAGDVNGDGIDDLIVGAPDGDDGGTDAGQAYVIYGQLGTRGRLDFNTLSASQGFVIQGDAAYDHLGNRVSAGGDVNGDGIGDLIISAETGDDGGRDAGEAYVIYGQAGASRARIDLTTLSASQGFIIQGEDIGAAPVGYGGLRASSAGDVNGDGFDDLIVGSPDVDDGGIDAGQAYVIYGQAGTSRGRVDLSTLSPSQGFIIQGDVSGDNAGRSVSAAGDVNGDGLDDLIVGAPYGDDGGTNAGEAYVVYGFRSNIIDLSSLSPSQGFVIQGDSAHDLAGWSVSEAGDVNGDGIDDLIVGAPTGIPGFRLGEVSPSAVGESYVIYGQAGTRGMLDLSTLSASQGFVIRGQTNKANLTGHSVSSAGDVNGDGIDDLIVGDPHGDDGAPQAGEAYVIYGQTGASRGLLEVRTLSASQGFVIQGFVQESNTGWSVSSAGDVNGDGLDDLLVGQRKWNNPSVPGEAYVIYGQAGSSRGRIDLSTLSSSQGFTIQGGNGEVFGHSVSSAGDVNGDGIDDLIVGAQGGNDGGTDAGEAYVIYGQAGTRGRIDATTLSPSQGFVIQGDTAGDLLGECVSSAGDVNGDGIGDLIVSAPRGDDGGRDAAEAYVIYGQTGTSRGRLDLTTLSASQGFVIQGEDIGAAMSGYGGLQVSSAGDVNGDGIGDLLVGSPYVDDGGIEAGQAYVIYGQSGTSRGRLDLTTLAPSQGFIIQGDAAGDFAGGSVSAAGDVNGDGLDDLIVGAPYGDDGGTNAGEAYVVYGFRNTSTVPTLTGFGPSVTFAENLVNATPQLLDADVVFNDVEGNFNGGRLTLSGLLAEDRASVRNEGTGAGQIGLSGANVTFGGVVIGTLAGGSGATLTITFNAAATSVAIDALIQNLTYANVSDTPTASRNLVLNVTDAAGDSLAGSGGGPLAFAERTGAANPFNGVAVGTVNTPTFADLDGDGDLDAVVGEHDVGLNYFENTGTATAPIFTQRTGAANPFNGVNVSHSAPTFADLDGDGDLDAVIGEHAGFLNYFENTGTATAPIFTQRTGAANPFNGVDVGIVSTPTLADLDGDGDLDAVIGEQDGVLNYFQNTGTATAPIFTQRTGAANPFNGVDVGGPPGPGLGDSAPTFADLDGDGDLDAVIGDRVGILNYFRNTGTATAPVFVQQTGAANPFNGVDVGYLSRPNFADLDGDGDLDAGVGDYDGPLNYFENTTVRGQTITVTVTAQDDIPTVTGTAGNDQIYGTSGDDVINGLGGNDIIDGGAGRDILRGGQGDDIYFVDTIDDVLQEFGGQGRDIVYTTVSFRLREADDIELLFADPRGGTSALNLAGNGIANLIFGNDGANILEGGGGDDALYGYLGNDTLNGGLGVDTMAGGLGDDIYFIDTIDDVLQEFGGQGRDIVYTNVSFRLRETDDIELLVADPRLGTSALNLAGNGIANLIFGNDGANILEGGGGDDALFGYLGNDTLNGGTGVDTLVGGLGDDTYFIDTIDDVLQEFAGQGRDTVYTTVNFRLRDTDDIELLIADPRGGTSGLNLAGNGIANLIFGNDGVNILEGGGGDDALFGYLGNDTLNGGLGVDTMVGGLGDDIYFIDTIDDVLQEFSGEGRDIVYTTVNFRLRETDDIELLVADPRGGTSALNLAGNGIANLIFGNDGVNILEGGGGNDALYGYLGNDTLNGGLGVDTMVGGLGDDIYFVDTIDDILQEFSGQGRDFVYSTVSYRLRASDDIEVLLADPRASTAAINLTGNDLVNSLIGNAGANVLDGKGGNDFLTGNEGADSFGFSTALNGVSNVDTILGFSVTEDRVLLGAGGGQPFSGLTVGVLASGAFATGSAATTADHRIIYNAADGSLFFDADGSGAGTAIQFANIGVGLALTASHFTVTGTLAGAPEPTSKGAAADPQVLPGVADDGFVILAKDSDAPLVLPGADGFDDFADPDVLVPPMPLNQMLTIGDNGELISGSGGLGGRHDHDGWLF